MVRRKWREANVQGIL